MRLQEIVLHNFGSFADQTIDLREVNAATAAGMNGAGKSTAFIDGPLWTLFGKCRSQMDAMIRLGETEMSCGVVFALNGQTYRVVRKRSIQTKAGKSELSLAVQNGPGWNPVAGGKVAEVQEKIIALLGADYDLLIATSFLVQGNADRFSRATAGERKTILASILRLDRYAQLGALAHRRSVEQGAQATTMQDLLTNLRAKSAMGAELRGQKITIETKCEDHEYQRHFLEDERQASLTQQATLQAKLTEIDTIAPQLQTERAREQRLEGLRTSYREQQERIDKILQNADTIRAKVQEEEMAKARLNDILESNTTLNTEAGQLRDQDQAARAKVEELICAENALTVQHGKVETAIKGYRAETERLRQTLARHHKSVELLGQVPCDERLQGLCQFTQQAVIARDIDIPNQETAIRNRVEKDEDILALLPEAEILKQCQEALGPLQLLDPRRARSSRKRSPPE